MNAKTDKPLLRIDNLKKHFEVSISKFSREKGLVKAVDGINLAVSSGKTLALVGESGCGKTTTARLILRLDYPTDGHVYYGNKDIHQIDGQDLKEFRKKVQAVFQDPWASLNPRIKVDKLISESIVINEHLSKEQIRTRVEKVLEEVGLRPEQGKNYPHEFSGGQRQRVAIASALISNPDIVILDEPVSALDVSIRSQIMNLLKDIQKRNNVSYLLIAHDLGTTRYMADEIAVMYLGKVIEKAPTERLFENYKHPYTKALFSAALPSHPDDNQDDDVGLQGEIPSPLHPPSGCPFHTRCPDKIGPICEKMIPLLQFVNSDSEHIASCHLLDG